MKCTMTREVYREFVQADIRSKPKLHLRWILLVILLVIYFILGILCTFLPPVVWPVAMIPTGAMILFCGIYQALLPRIMLRGTLKSAVLSLDQPVETDFFSEQFVMRTPYGEAKMTYDRIHHMVETDRILLLYYSDNTATLVMRSSMTKGTLEELVHFLWSVTPVPYKRYLS